MLLASTSKMFSSHSLLSMMLFHSLLSMLILGQVVDVDFVVSSLVCDDLEVLDVLDVHLPSRFVQCFAMMHFGSSEGRSLML